MISNSDFPPPILFNNEDFKNKFVVAICEQCISFGNYNRVTTRNLATGFLDMFLVFGRVFQFKQLQASSKYHDIINEVA